MPDPEGIRWRWGPDAFVRSLYLSVLGRPPENDRVVRAHAAQVNSSPGSRARMFWRFITCPEYQRSSWARLPRDYNVWWNTLWDERPASGRRLCHCYYVSRDSLGGYMPSFQYTGVPPPSGPFTLGVALALARLYGAFDRETCPSPECGSAGARVEERLEESPGAGTFEPLPTDPLPEATPAPPGRSGAPPAPPRDDGGWAGGRWEYWVTGSDNRRWGPGWFEIGVEGGSYVLRNIHCRSGTCPGATLTRIDDRSLTIRFNDEFDNELSVWISSAGQLSGTHRSPRNRNVRYRNETAKVDGRRGAPRTIQTPWRSTVR